MTTTNLPPIARIVGGRRGCPGQYLVDDTAAVLARLWRSTMVNETTGCWEWQGARSADGYGNVRLKSALGKTSVFFTHRLGWVATGHTAPEGMQLDHGCRNTPCWNPEHLEEVTNQENTKRGQRGQFRCDHDPQGSDIYYEKNGRRRCAICFRAWSRAKRARQRSVA